MEKETFFTGFRKRSLRVLAVAIIFSFPAFSQIVNWDFEQTEPNELGAIPIGWNTENYALVHREFTPCFERGQRCHWSFEGNTVTTESGNAFLVLSTGDYGYDACGRESFSGRTNKGVAWQECTFYEGDTIYGRYFFGTGDYVGWNDKAEIKIIPSDPNNEPRLQEIVLAYIDVAMVGDFRSTDGWLAFSHTFTYADKGSYYLELGVYDVKDSIYKSYLMVDFIKIGDPFRAGDFNADGKVDILDMLAFDVALYQDCEFPDDPNDPNSICYYDNIFGDKVPFYRDPETGVDYRDEYGRTTLDALRPVFRNWLWKDE